MMAQPDPEPVFKILRDVTGRVALDVGANVGYVTDILARNFETVIAFEPALESYSELVKIQEKRKNVKVYNLAVGRTTGKMSLAVMSAPIQSGQLVNSSMPLNWGDVISEREIECTSIDTICYWERVIPDFIKIDTEGFEVDVINGALTTLRLQPRLYIEVHSEQNGRDIYETLLMFYDVKTINLFRHPDYKEGSREWRNHFWLTTKL